MSSSVSSSKLSSWSDYATGTSWEGIIIGNGASRAVWDDFSYPSLYDIARTPGTAHMLSAADDALFKALGNTRNFEGVLGALLTSRTVSKALGISTKHFDNRYESIRDALVAAVHKVHVPWKLVPKSTLLGIREALLDYDVVFSTNYDLLVYWAMMAAEEGEFKDYFWSGRFDPTNAEVWGKATKVLYLHGALHLYYGIDGGTYKETAGQFANLLDQFGKRPDGVPLCITEGSAQQKMAAIARSDYLSFAIREFSRRKGPLVILGQGLGDTDEHLAEILGRSASRTVAIAIYPSGKTDIVRQKAHYRKLLPEANLLFFDSTTHPLGDKGLRVAP